MYRVLNVLKRKLRRTESGEHRGRYGCSWVLRKEHVEHGHLSKARKSVTDSVMCLSAGKARLRARSSEVGMHLCSEE